MSSVEKVIESNKKAVNPEIEMAGSEKPAPVKVESKEIATKQKRKYTKRADKPARVFESEYDFVDGVI